MSGAIRTLTGKLILSATLALACASHIWAAETKPIRVTLRAVFGKGKLVDWQGKLTVKGGRILKVKNFLMDPGERGTYGVDQTSFSWEAHTIGLDDGFVVTIEGGLDTVLSITGKPFAKDMVLRRILTGPVVIPVGKARFRIARDPGDSLRLGIQGREHMVFVPGESLSPRVAINYVTASAEATAIAGKLVLEFVTMSVAGEVARPIKSQEVRLVPNQYQTLKLQLRVPDKEGVYRLRCRLRGLPEKTPPYADMEFVVIDPALKREPADAIEKVLVDEVDCTKELEPDRFIQYGDTKVKTTPLGAFRYTSTRSKGIFRVRNPVYDNTSWFAVRLKAEDLGAPHVVEVTYPDDDWRSIGISVIQPGPSNKLDWIQLDSGVICGGDNPSENKVKVHRVFVWPTVKRPVILITNRFPGKQAAVGKISLYRLAKGLPELPIPPATAGARRHMGFYYEEARFGETFSGPRMLAHDPTTRSKDPRGWLFFYKAMRNMVDYMKYTGLDAVDYLSVGYGDALYPSKLADINERYDNLELFSDPMQKDVLEMYLRIFDREGMTFIPEINLHRGVRVFETRHPATDPASQAMHLVHKTGKVLDIKKIRVGGARYNPLNPVWQDFVIALVREMAQRYKSHRAFAGIDLRVNTNVSIAYPNLDWGYGDFTMAMFTRDTGIKVPGTANDPKRYAERHAFLTSERRGEFIAWRCKKISGFHKRVAKALAAVREDLTLYLGFMNAFTSHFDAKANMGWEERVSPYQYMREKGMDLSLYKDTRNLALLRPRRETSFTYKLGRSGTEYKKERTFDSRVDDMFTSPGMVTGLKIFNEYHESRLMDFDRKVEAAGWFASSRIWLVGTHVIAEPHYMKRYAQAMNQLNAAYLFDGGWQAPFGREERLRKFAMVFRQIPAVRFKRLDLPTQPVGIHVAEYRGRGWVYLVNDSFAPVAVNLELTSAQAREVTRMGETGVVTMKVNNRESLAAFTIGPYLLVAFKTDTGPLQVKAATVTPGKFYLDWLNARLSQVKTRLAAQPDETTRKIIAELDAAASQKRWSDLWKLLESARVYQALIKAGVKPLDFYKF